MDTTSPEFEVMLFRSVIQHRPVGRGRHFSMAGMLSTLSQELGPKFDKISAQDVWAALEKFYNLKELDVLDEEYDSTAIQDFTLERLAEQDSELKSKLDARRYRDSPSPSHHGNSPINADSPLTDPEDEEEEEGSSATSDQPTPVAGPSNGKSQHKGQAGQSIPEEPPAEAEEEEEEEDQEDSSAEEPDEDDTVPPSKRTRPSKAASSSKHVQTNTSPKASGTPKSNEGSPRATPSNGGEVKKLSGAALAAKQKKQQKQQQDSEHKASSKRKRKR